MNKRITLKRIVAAVERAQRTTDNPGFCTACGEEVEGVEPDAEDYTCESCGEDAVCGAEQLLIMLA
jgi:predicted RNA-binding Zn-ribbon protein involved in translation (DUF1610 family)